MSLLLFRYVFIYDLSYSRCVHRFLLSDGLNILVIARLYS